MSKIITNELQAHGGPVVKLPTNAVAAGPIGLDASGKIEAFDLDAKLPPASKVLTKSYDFEANNTAKLKVLWTDFKEGLTKGDLAFVRMRGGGVSSSAQTQISVKGLDASGSEINAGYLGYNFSGQHGNRGSRIGSTSHNSNVGRWWFPLYTSTAQSDYNYGSGLCFDLTWHFKKEGSYGNYGIVGVCGYQQSTSYDYPNHETFAWDNYSRSTPPATAETGFVFYPNSGTLNRGSILVEIVLK